MRIYWMFRYWQAQSCLDRIFTGSVAALHATELLDTDVLHGDGTTTAAAKKDGDKVVAFCDRKGNVIAPFEVAPGNRNESPRLRDALPQLRRMARTIGFSLQGSSIAWTASTTAAPIARPSSIAA